MKHRPVGALRGDIFGGLTAAVVALPLALAFGVASGIGPMAGMYGAIAVGFFASVFGGTSTQVSGPTGPMTVVMAVIVAEHAQNISEAFTIVVLGGGIQILLGLLRVGRFISYTPYSVISGFMSGIGLIIIVLQTLPMFGLPGVNGGPINVIREWPNIFERGNIDAVILTFISLSIMVFWPKRLNARIPSPLVALIAGSLLAAVLFHSAPVIGDVPIGIPEIYIPKISLVDLPLLIQPAIILALLGSIDSLLTSLVADSITRTKHNSDRELIGQGIGNMVAGFIGACPGAGATMRTIVNIKAGGNSSISGAFHAIILLALVLGLGPLAEQIPLSVLAGILIKVGWDIIDWGYLKRVRKAPRDKVIVMIITLILTVFVDLITAVAIGLILAGFVTSRWREQHELKGITAVSIDQTNHLLSGSELELNTNLNNDVALISMSGTFSYASARELVHRIATLHSGQNIVIFDFTDAVYVDTSAALAIEELFEDTINSDAICLISGLAGEVKNTLVSLKALTNIPPDCLFSTRIEAIQ